MFRRRKKVDVPWVQLASKASLVTLAFVRSFPSQKLRRSEIVKERKLQFTVV